MLHFLLSFSFGTQMLGGCDSKCMKSRIIWYPNIYRVKSETQTNLVMCMSTGNVVYSDMLLYISVDSEGKHSEQPSK